MNEKWGGYIRLVKQEELLVSLAKISPFLLLEMGIGVDTDDKLRESIMIIDRY